MAVPMLQGAIPDMSDMNTLGENLGNLINPNGKYLNALKQEVIKNPEVRQKYIDMEAENPGTLNRLFGSNVSSMFGMGTPSTGATQDMFNRDNATVAPSMLPNTIQGIASAKERTGSTPNELAEQGSNASAAASRATVEGAAASVAPDKAKLEDASALADLQQLPLKIASENADLNRNIQNKKLLSAVEANPVVAKSGGIIANLVGDTKIIPDAAKAAILSDPGYNSLFNKTIQEQRVSLANARADAVEARQKATIDDQITRNGAISIAANAGKMGFAVDGDDIFNIKKAGLESQMDHLSTMNAAQLTDAAAKDPAIDLLIQHPTMIHSWLNYNAYLGAATDKETAPLQKGYEAEKNNFEKNATKGVYKTESDAQAAIGSLTSNPYAVMMAKRGTPLPIPHYDASQGNAIQRGLNIGKKVFYTDPHTGTVLQDNKDASTPPTTPQQGQVLDQMAQLIASGKATYNETIKDPQFKAFGSGADTTLNNLVAKYRQQMLTQPKSP